MIRKIESRDKKTYMDLVKEFYSSDAVLHPVPDEYFERTFEEMMRSKIYTEGFLLEKDGVTAGYALIAKTFSQEAGGLTVWIEEIYLRPEFRSCGLGSEFFEFLEKNRPAARYRLEVEPENERAVSLYRRKGFEVLPYDQLCKEFG